MWNEDEIQMGMSKLMVTILSRLHDQQITMLDRFNSRYMTLVSRLGLQTVLSDKLDTWPKFTWFMYHGVIVCFKV